MFNFKFFFIFSSILLFGQLLFGQCNDKIEAFATGENLSYKVSYNWQFIWIDAAQVGFKINDTTIYNQKFWHLISSGNTYPSKDWIMRVRDTYEAYIAPNQLKPYLFRNSIQEGSKEIHENYRYDYSGKKVLIDKKEKGKPDFTTTINLQTCVMDILTAVYYCRNLDYTKCKPEEKISLKIILNNKINDVYITYLGTENYQMPDGKIISCIKIKPLLIEGTLFSKGEGMTVWMTNDKNKVPVMVEAKIIIGSIKAYLIKSEGLKN